MLYTPQNFEYRKKPTGFFQIGIENLCYEENLGTLWRSAYLLGASSIFTIGKIYKPQVTDTTKTYKSIPLHQYRDMDEFLSCRSKDTKLVGIEIDDEAQCLVDYKHFERTVYLLGSETNGLSKRAIESCHDLVYVPSIGCLNVAATGSIVMYDRISKMSRNE